MPQHYQQTGEVPVPIETILFVRQDVTDGVANTRTVSIDGQLQIGGNTPPIFASKTETKSIRAAEQDVQGFMSISAEEVAKSSDFNWDAASQKKVDERKNILFTAVQASRRRSLVVGAGSGALLSSGITGAILEHKSNGGLWGSMILIGVAGLATGWERTEIKAENRTTVIEKNTDHLVIVAERHGAVKLVLSALRKQPPNSTQG